MKKDSRNLDVLRAFAVLCVFFAHIRQFVVHLPFQLYEMARFGVLNFFRAYLPGPALLSRAKSLQPTAYCSEFLRAKSFSHLSAQHTDRIGDGGAGDPAAAGRTV